MLDADLNDDGWPDIIVTSQSSVWFENPFATLSSAFVVRTLTPFTSFVTPGLRAVGDLDNDGDQDVLIIYYGTASTQVWLENTLCPRGQFGSTGTGNAPCLPCRAGAFGARGLVSGSPFDLASCSGLCPAGQYSLSGAATCTPCPVGRYGNTTGLATALCSGECVAGSGRVCGEGATTNGPGDLCPAGSYANATLSRCVPCAAGFYGSAPGLVVPECSGVCIPAPGRFCGTGATSATGIACPLGRFSEMGSVTSCDPCPAGRFGNVTGQVSSDCSGACVAPAGSVCVSGAAFRLSASVCHRGTYSPGGTVTACVPCPAGYFGGAVNLSSPACSGQCPVGTFSHLGASSCTPCPGQLRVIGTASWVPNPLSPPPCPTPRHLSGWKRTWLHLRPHDVSVCRTVSCRCLLAAPNTCARVHVG